VSVTHDQCDARPMVTFPAYAFTNLHLPRIAPKSMVTEAKPVDCKSTKLHASKCAATLFEVNQRSLSMKTALVIWFTAYGGTI